MNAKGTAVKAVKDFVIERHGPEGVERWLAAMPPESRKIMSDTLLASAWYPFREGVVQPMEALATVFYNGSARGNWEQARFTAEKDLHGIYRAFVRIASPAFLIKNAAGILGSYYSDVTTSVTETGRNSAVMEIRGIDPPSRYYDHSVAGWMERALEICGCKGITIAISNPAADGARLTRYEVTWQ